MLKQKIQSVMIVICTVLLASIAGCGGGVTDIDPDLVPVKGTISLDGQSLKSGTIGFSPEDESGSSSVGIIKEGHFTLKKTASSIGAKPGKYKVSVRSWSTQPTMGKEGVSAIPKKYNNPLTSGLTAEVKKEGNNFTFDLKSN